MLSDTTTKAFWIRKNGVGQWSITSSIHSSYHLILEGVLAATLRRFSIRDDVVGRPLYLDVERERVEWVEGLNWCEEI